MASKKRYLLGCGTLLVLALITLVWWSRNPILFTVPEGLLSEVTARQLEDPSGSAVIVELELSGETSGYIITEISLGRELAKKLGVSPPAGFEEESLPIADDEMTDPEIVRFVGEWNDENVRWVGEVGIEPATPLIVHIPGTDPLAETGPVEFSYEKVSVLGGLWSSTSLVLNETAD